MSRYPNLAGEIARRGVKKVAISRHLGISYRSFSNKMNGRSPFTLNEAMSIQRQFFPSVDIDDLFATEGDEEKMSDDFAS